MKKLLISVVRIRKHLLKNGKSFKNEMKCHSLIEKFENHLACYPKISDRKLKHYMAKHLDDIIFLLPKNPTGDSIKEQINHQLCVNM